MSETYNLYNLEAPFKEYLDAGNQKPVSIKNYGSDIRHFFGWLILYFKSNDIRIESEITITQFITLEVISEYKSYLSENNIPHKTINRRLSTIRKFCSFCISQGWMKDNPAKQIINIGGVRHIEPNKASESPKKTLVLMIKEKVTDLRNSFAGLTTKTEPTAKLPLQYYIGFVLILIFVFVMGTGIYNQFFVTNNQSLAYPTALTRAGRILSFQGRLTDTLSNPITTATNVQFRLWKVSTGGTEGTCTSLGGEDCLYKTGTCSVTPDQDGIFSTLIGSDCGSEIAASVFTENPNVYLGITVGGDAEMTPRQQIANVGYAINSETLQGLPPGTGTSVIPYINLDGNLLISASSPGIRSTSTSTDFTLSSAKATIIQSAGTGDVIIQATESGTLIFRTGGDTGANTRITVDNNGLVGIGTPTPGQALDIIGNLQFSGALMPGSLAGSPGQFLISSGSGVAPTWTSSIAATSIPFSGITSGTNATAAMIVDTGASLNYSNSGTINASSLIGGTWAAPGTIGSTTPNTGAFTTLTSSGNTTLATGASTTNTFGSGTSSINTIGSTTTPGVLTLHGATTLDNSFTVSGSNLTSLGGNLTVSGTSWTATPTISGLITATSGLTANGNLVSNANTTLGNDISDIVTVNSGAWTFANDTNFALSGGVNGLSLDTDTLSIDAQNNLVGIGTTNPMAKLDVVGDLNVSTYATVGASLAVGYPAAPAGPGNAIFSGNVGIGTASNDPTAILDLTSTTKGFLAPRMTTTERDAIVTPATGLMIYNTVTNQYNVFNGTVWGAVGGGGSGAWSSLTDPSMNLGLNMADYTSTFTYNATTGANNLFNLTDTLNNTGTGYLLNITTASGSTLKPFHVSAAGNEALTVLANGNVGVGNASPSSLFSVGSGDPFQIDGSGNTSLDNQADLRFYEANANGSNYTGFQAPSAISTDVLYTLPDADGLLGQVLQTNGTGGLSWLDIDTNPNVGPWSVNNGALFPDNSTLDLFIGGTASSSAKFAFINVDSGTPTASISGNLALGSPTGANPAGTLSMFNGGSFNFQTSVGGDAGLLSRLFITNSGNLGIGTTSPTQKLTIQQDGVADILGIKDGANNTSLLLADGGVTTFKPSAFDIVQTCSGASCVSADTGSFTDNTTEAKSNVGTPYIMLPVAAAGSGSFYMGLDHKFATINVDVVTANIGMSTMLVEYWNGAAWASVSPTDNTTRLTVDGTITFTAPTDWATNSVNGTTKYYIRLRNSVGSISTAPTAYFSTPTTGSRFYVYGQSGDADASLYVGDNGNVGVGTNNPQARLDIGGATSTITNSSGDITIDAASNFISFAGDTLTNFSQATGGTGTAAAPTYSFTSSTNTGLYLATTNVLRFSTNGSDRVTIDALGNVGIGTTSPAYKLDVAGAIGGNYFVDNDNANYGLDPAGIANFGGNSLKISGGALLAYDTGKVGIGNQTPVGKLDVSGFVTGKALTILNETGNQALLTASASGVTKFTVNHDGSITLAAQTSAPSSLNGGPLVSGTIYYSNTTVTGGLTGVTAPSNTGANTGDLFLYGEDSAWHRIALDMTQYSTSAANITNTSYIEIAHNQNTFDISLTGWVKDIVTNLWKRISDFTATVKRALDNEFNPEFTQKQKVTSVSLKPNIGNLGTGGDGAITINGTTDINTTSSIAGRSCADGGDAVNYSVSALTSLTATLTTSPSTPSCLAVGDEVLLINLEGSWTSTNPNLGNWETLRISSVVGPTITFTTAKTKYYGSGATDDSGLGATNGTQRVMLQRVPNYTNVTLGAAGNFSPTAWNGTKGGVMFFRATGTVAVAGGGILHAAGRGWRGGGEYGAWYGGQGGETWVAGNSYPSAGGAMGGNYNGAAYANNLAGGGGGGGATGYNGANTGYAGTAGVGSYGGAGGGGGGAYASHASYHGYGGGGGGGGGLGGPGGGGAPGTGGSGAAGGAGNTGGTSGAGGAGAYCSHGCAGGGGGGGQLTFAGIVNDTGATKMIFGSGGGGGGTGEISQVYYAGVLGGTGGGIVYIAANTITVSGTNGISAYGAGGANSNSGVSGAGGGGAGGTIKLVGSTLNLGSGAFTAVNAGGGAGGGGASSTGGAGGSGRIGFYNSTASVAPSSTSPAAGYDSTLNTNNYSLFVSDEIHTPNATTYNKIKWLADLKSYGNVELQTRSGATSNSTDNSWEPWTPATASANLLGLDDANTHTNWVATNGTSNEGSTALSTPSGVWSKVNNAAPGTCDSGAPCSYGEGRIGLGTAGKGDSTHLESMSIIKDGATYKMWYSGYAGDSKWRIYYATSSDGLTWTKYDNAIPATSDTTGTNGRIPLATTAGRGDVNGAHSPAVIKDGSTYKMWYAGNNGTDWRIYYATSADGLTWTKVDNTVPGTCDSGGACGYGGGRLGFGTAGKGDTGTVIYHTVILDGSTYKMWYSGSNGAGTRGYYATSSDGLTWTKYDNTAPPDSNGASTNGRLPWGTSGTGDDANTAPQSVIKDGSIYKMWYAGHDGAAWRIYYATSPDGINWAKIDNTTPLSTSDTTSNNGKVFLGSAGKSDVTHAFLSTVLNDGGNYKMWYNAHNGTERVSYATMPNITTPTSPARNVNYFEDEDESDTTKFTLLSSTFSGAYDEISTGSANLANHDYLALWVMAAEAGNTVKVGFGEANATEHEQFFDIAARDVWQKIYWDISKIPTVERDAVKFIRITNTGSLTNYIYFDNIVANRFMTNPDGSTIMSSPNEYFQYRAILTTSQPGFFATLHNVQFEWNNGYKIEQTNANKVRLYNYTGEEQELRLDAIVFGADLAEWYTVNDLTVEAGDVVAMTGQLDDYGVPILKKADETNEDHLVGIISTKAGQTLGLEAADRRLLALAGRVPVKIATDSAPIKFGDLLTSSETPGYAKKAGIGQQTVGKALESWANNMDKKTILALVGNSIAGPDVGAIQDITKVGITKIVNEFGSTTYQLIDDAGNTVESTAAYSKAIIANLQAGIIQSTEIISETMTATQKFTSPIADIGTLNVSEKIRSPIVETTDLVASGTAKINEIKPVDRDLTINLENQVESSSSGEFSINEPENFTKGHLSKIIIKGLEGKTVTTIDAEGNASFAGQIIADSLTINNDATVSGNFASNTLTVNDASVSGKLIAGEIESNTIDSLNSQLTNSVNNINDIQQLLADIRNQPVPDLNNQTNLSDTLGNFESMTVSGNSNLYNVSVSNSLLVGTTLVDQNSIISLASELKLSALSAINLFDGAVMIARDGKITTRGEIIAQGGIRTNEIKALVDEGQVTINNLAVNNIAVVDRYLEATTSASIIAAADNFDINGIFAPAIETATASAGIAILPEDSNEIVIYNNYVKTDSLIYLTPTSLTYPVTLTVGQKEECLSTVACKKYFTVVTNTPTSLPVKFNWLIIN